MSQILIALKKMDVCYRVGLPNLARELIGLKPGNLVQIKVDRDKKIIIIEKDEKKEG